jgi:hypothetical protein
MGEVIARCTKTDREKRYATVAEVRPDVLRAIRLVKPPNEVEEANEEWLERVRGEDWTAQQATDFAAYILGDPHDRKALLDELRPKALVAIHGASPYAWQDVARELCKRAHDSFPFAFCDVLIQSLLNVYKLGGVATRSLAVHAAAELGASHHRWHVMHQLEGMAGPFIDEALARRIVIDGNLSDRTAQAKANLVSCAKEINSTPDAMYHPIIATWLR